MWSPKYGRLARKPSLTARRSYQDLSIAFVGRRVEIGKSEVWSFVSFRDFERQKYSNEEKEEEEEVVKIRQKMKEEKLKRDRFVPSGKSQKEERNKKASKKERQRERLQGWNKTVTQLSEDLPHSFTLRS